MAVLTGRGRRLLPALLVASLAGCFVFEQLRGDRGSFSHELHVVEQGVACATCHEPGPDDGPPAMPARAVCWICHRDLDADKPADRRADAYYPDGVFTASDPVTPLADEILFSHAGHVERSDCNTCHPGIERNVVAAELPRLDMDGCMGCHDTLGAPNDCATCHREIDTDQAPASHAFQWTTLHGDRWRHPEQTLTDRCDLCHTESTCVQCHRSEQPASHTNAWRERYHGLDAAFDRASCQVCHQDDSCARCHRSTEPRSHTAGFGSPLNTHCLSCHFPLGNETCAVCHEATPSHGDATPMPDVPIHDIGFNCRQCHGAGASLPHVDDGSACTLCHR